MSRLKDYKPVGHDMGYQQMKGGGAKMALWIIKLTEYAGQYRLTIPKKVIQVMQLTDATHVTLEDGTPDALIIRRLEINGEKTTD